MYLFIIVEFWDFNEVLWGFLFVIYRIMWGTSDCRLFGMFKGFLSNLCGFWCVDFSSCFTDLELKCITIAFAGYGWNICSWVWEICIGMFTVTSVGFALRNFIPSDQSSDLYCSISKCFIVNSWWKSLVI